MLKTEIISYHDGNTSLEGYCAYDEKQTTKKPGVLIVHDWSGRNHFAEQKAKQLAELGYVGFAVDMYGEGKTGNTKEEKAALMTPVLQDRPLLLRRMTAALNTLRNLDQVDTHRLAAIGFCFGGLCALDLARSGADIRGVVSFHGALTPPPQTDAKSIKAALLVLHGYDDPMVTPDQVDAFAKEMTRAQADWQINMYGHTMHAFTNPEANDPDFGTVYQPKTEARAFNAMQLFFKEIFAM